MTLLPLLSYLEQLDANPPSFAHSARRSDAFAGIARFLESNIRAGQPFDLKTVHPNPLWQCFEDRLDKALNDLGAPTLSSNAMRVHQWYSSGILLEAGPRLFGFDVVLLHRNFGWEDRFNMTDRLAASLDALFITHCHADHYDELLVRACVHEEVPVYMPVSVARNWKPSPFIIPIEHNAEWLVGDLPVKARHGVHIWRSSFDEVPLLVYEMVLPDETLFVYGGDVDYTKDLAVTPGRAVKAFFIPWRAPNARYEAGDDRQIGTIQQAIEIALERLKPEALFYQHCAELEHMYDGFPASFDLALENKATLPVASELMFWGEWMDL